MNSGFARSSPLQVHGRQRDLLPPGPGRRFPPGQVLVLGHRIPHEIGAMRQRRRAPLRDGVIDPVERRRADVPHLDHDLHVGGAQRIELLSLVGADEHVERARHHRERRAQVVGRGRGIRHRDRDDHVGTGLPGDVHRDVAREPAVPEDAAVDAHGREHAGHGHARPHRERQVAAIEDDHLAALHVGGHGAERNGQLVEFRDAAAATHEVLDRQVHVLRVDQAGRRNEAAVTHAELQAVAVGVADELAAHRHLRAQSAAGDGCPARRSTGSRSRVRPRSCPRRRCRRPARPCSCRRCNRRECAVRRARRGRRRAPRPSRRRRRAPGRCAAGVSPAPPRRRRRLHWHEPGTRRTATYAHRSIAANRRGGPLTSVHTRFTGTPCICTGRRPGSYATAHRLSRTSATLTPRGHPRQRNHDVGAGAA